MKLLTADTHTTFFSSKERAETIAKENQIADPEWEYRVVPLGDRFIIVLFFNDTRIGTL